MTTNPVAAEALGEETVAVAFDDVEYTIPTTANWSYDALEAIEEGRSTGFLREVLGAAQLAQFKARKPKVSDVNAFVVAIQKAVGIQGN
jgi:hypothetical protein